MAVQVCHVAWGVGTSGQNATEVRGVHFTVLKQITKLQCVNVIV